MFSGTGVSLTASLDVEHRVLRHAREAAGAADPHVLGGVRIRRRRARREGADRDERREGVRVVAELVLERHCDDAIDGDLFFRSGMGIGKTMPYIGRITGSRPMAWPSLKCASASNCGASSS